MEYGKLSGFFRIFNENTKIYVLIRIIAAIGSWTIAIYEQRRHTKDTAWKTRRKVTVELLEARPMLSADLSCMMGQKDLSLQLNPIDEFDIFRTIFFSKIPSRALSDKVVQINPAPNLFGQNKIQN